MKLSMFKGDGELYGLTEDSEGGNLPESMGPWTYVRDIELERDSGSRVALDPVIAFDAINDQGFYLSNVEITIEENEP